MKQIIALRLYHLLRSILKGVSGTTDSKIVLTIDQKVMKEIQDCFNILKYYLGIQNGNDEEKDCN